MSVSTTSDWWTRAACKGMDAALFFPEAGRADRAKKVCARCPVRRRCLEDAMTREAGADAGARAGVWGGLSPDERFTLYRCRRGRCGHGAGCANRGVKGSL